MSEQKMEMEVTIKAYQVIEKTVKPSGNSGRVYVPREWIGKKVKVFLLESITDNENGEKRKEGAVGNGK